MLNSDLSPTFGLRTPAPPHMCALRTHSCSAQSPSNCPCASKPDSVNADCLATALWEAHRFYLREKTTDSGLCKSFSKAKPSYSLGLTSHPIYSPTRPQSLLHHSFPSSFSCFLRSFCVSLLHFHALSGSCSHVVVGPFPTQHTSVLAHSARVCSSRQQRTCWLSTGCNSNGEARSTDDKFKYFRIEPNFISVLSALVVTVMNTTGLGFLEALPADPALHRAAMSDVLPAETSVSRGCGQSLSQAPHSQNKGGLQHRCCDSAALEAAFYGQVSFHFLLLVISSSSTPRELYCAGDRGALEDWTREAASGEF